MKNIAIVTGASSGMGRDFALAVDKEFELDELWVIARRKERLVELSGSCRAEVIPISLDLCQEESIEEVRQLLEKEAPNIKVLVNAAGFGVFGEFEKMDTSELMDIVDLNAKALMAITRTCLPYMHKNSKIINLGSNGSWQPVPYETVYAATKSFVLSFSRAIGKELESRKIKVLCVCPDWIKTEFLDIAVRDNTINYFDHWYESKDVVKQAMKDLKKGKTVSILGFPVKMQVLLVKLLPHNFIMNTWCKQQGKK